MTIQLTTLGHGLRVVTEHLPGARSVTTGFWVGVGGRDESAAEAGSSHFLEHLLFKGTEARSAVQIAEAVDAVGGDMNAFTAQEHTAYYTRLPAGELDLGLDVLSDVVWSPACRADDVEAERRVILDELAMEEDTPDDRVVVLLGEGLFPEHELGREVLGSRETISAMDRDAIASFHGRWYRPANVVVAVAGAVDHDAVVSGVAARFSGDAGSSGGAPVRTPPTAPARPFVSLTRPTEQAYLAVGYRGLARDDPDRFALAVANQILGGGVSSRLFQTIREERGLAYGVQSYPITYADAGALVISAGTSPEHLGEVLGLVDEEVERFVEHGPTADELRVATGYLVGSTLLGLEDSGGCMARIGKAVLNHGGVLDLDDLLDRYRAVGAADVARVASRVLDDRERTVAVVGRGRAVSRLRGATGSGGTRARTRQRSGV
ncbi:MAG: M16 family metallopeptidase [Acidimicrobiia bacterium]